MIFLPKTIGPEQEDVEESGYLASVSDLMVGILFVFIIMVVMLSQRVDEVEGANSKDPLASAINVIGEKLINLALSFILIPPQA